MNSVGNIVVNPDIKDNLSQGAKLYPVSFEVGLFTPSSAIEWDSQNVVIQHGAHSIKLPLSPTDPILINGVQITPTGNVITALGTDLDAFKAEYDTHILAYNAHILEFNTMKASVTSLTNGYVIEETEEV